jgi:glucan phosphorylase
MMCAIDPIASFGGYSVMLNHTLLPAAVENTEQDLEKAIVSSYKENTQVVNQQMAAQARAKQQSDQQIEASAQAYIGRFAR